MTAMIAFITDEGLIEIKFNDNIKPWDLAADVTKDINIELVTSYDITEEPQVNLTFKWSVTSIQNEIMNIQLNFTNPTDVSLRLQQDEIKLRFVNETLVRHQDKFSFLDTKYLVLTKKIPR